MVKKTKIKPESKPKKIKKSEAGKGDSPRPFSVPLEDYGKRWEIVFGKKRKNKNGKK